MRSACAFGVTEVLVVGAKKLALFGNQGTAGHAATSHFESLEVAKAELTARGARLCGVEIDDSAVPVHQCPFTGSTAFMLGNEGCGMTPAQRAACDFFVYIPQHSGATASLNVAVAGSIVLHHFALWASMPEQPRFQQPTEAERQEMERKRAERTAKRRRDGVPDEASEDEDESLDC